MVHWLVQGVAVPLVRFGRTTWELAVSRARFHGRYANMAIVLQRILIIIWALGVLRFGSLRARPTIARFESSGVCCTPIVGNRATLPTAADAERNKFSVQAGSLNPPASWTRRSPLRNRCWPSSGRSWEATILTRLRLRRLALMHQEKGDFAAGRQFDEQVLAATKRSGKDHWQSINAAACVGNSRLAGKASRCRPRPVPVRRIGSQRAQALHAMHDVSAAIAPALEATEVYRRVFGDMHLEYGNSLNAFGKSVRRTRENIPRPNLFIGKRCRLARAPALGERHPYYATRLDNLGSIDRLAGDDAKAEPLLREALKIRKEALGEKHPDYIATLDRLADVCGANGDFAEARKLDVELLAEMTRRLGKDHWQTVNVRKAMERMAFLEQQSPEGQQSYLRAGGLARDARKLVKEGNLSQAVAPTLERQWRSREKSLAMTIRRTPSASATWRDYIWIWANMRRPSRCSCMRSRFVRTRWVKSIRSMLTI